MFIAAADFFVAAPAAPWDGPDTVFEENLDTARLTALVTGSDPAHTDVDVSLALMDLVRADLHLSGTSGDQRLSDSSQPAPLRPSASGVPRTLRCSMMQPAVEEGLPTISARENRRT